MNTRCFPIRETSVLAPMIDTLLALVITTKIMKGIGGNVLNVISIRVWVHVVGTRRIGFVLLLARRSSFHKDQC